MYFTVSDDFVPPEPDIIEEDEAELELQKQLEKQRKLKQKQQLKDSGEKVNNMTCIHHNQLVFFCFCFFNCLQGISLNTCACSKEAFKT